MSVRPKISVIINCLDGERYLREALDSVFAQTWGDWEVVFFDNASSDSSGSIACSYGEKVRYHRHAHTIKLGAARNEAMRLAQGEFIAFLDCDDLWAPRHLAALLEAFARDPACGLAYTDTIMVRDTVDNVVGRLSEQYTPATGRAFFALVPDVYISPAMAMFPRRVLDDAGWFDESYDFVEESDLFLRIARHHTVQYVAEPLTIYRYHGNNHSRRFLQQQAEAARFQADLLRRYPDIVQRLPALPMQWKFGYHAGHLRWYLGQRNLPAVVRTAAKLALVAVGSPGYAWWRTRNFVARYRGKGRQADWLT